MPLNERNITLRQALATDWPAIAALLRANALPLDGAQSHLAAFIVATSGLDIVGVAGAEVYGDLALLRSVAVAPGRQRQGIGESLVRRLLDEARRSAIRQVFLLTTTAAGYFPRFGFRMLSRERAPGALQASAELQGACPQSAALMSLSLVDDCCCGGPPKADAAACCASDETARSQGKSGCGCGDARAEAESIASASAAGRRGSTTPASKAKAGCRG